MQNGYLTDTGAISGWEPIESWRHLSRQFRAVLNVAARLHAGFPGSDQDWSAL
jgi:hypothetical protein